MFSMAAISGFRPYRYVAARNPCAWQQALQLTGGDHRRLEVGAVKVNKKPLR